MKKRVLTVILTVALALGMMPATAFAGLTEAKTPRGLGNTSLKWVYDFQSGGMDFTKAPTVPALVGGALYVGSANKVYKFNKNTGKIVARSKALSGRMGYGTTPMIGDSTGVYVFVTGSRVIKLSTDLRKVLWKGQAFPGQNTVPIKEIDGRIYGGTWGDDQDGGTYFCLDAATGKTIWTVYDTEGFYWAGAVECAGTVFFASDSSLKDGKTMRGSANIYAVAKDAPAGTKPSVVFSEPNTRIRSTPAVDSDGFLYYTSIKEDRKGALTKYSYDGSKLTRVKSVSIGTSSNTPVVDGDVLFLGDGNYMEGGDGRCIYAVDRNTLKIKAKAHAPAPVQGELLVAKGADRYRIYATYNSEPGGLFYVEMPLTADKVSKAGETFRPIRSQYCISDVVVDEETGTIYYKNDSGSIMAVKEGNDKAKVTGLKVADAGDGVLNVSWKGRENVRSYEVLMSKNGKSFKKVGGTLNTQLPVRKLTMGKTYRFKVRARLLAGKAKDSAVAKGRCLPGAPGNVKVKKTGGKAKVSWAKVKGATGYVVYQAASKKGKYKTAGTIVDLGKSKYLSDKLKKGTYYYKVRGFVTAGGKKVFGRWSEAASVRIK